MNNLFLNASQYVLHEIKGPLLNNRDDTNVNA